MYRNPGIHENSFFLSGKFSYFSSCVCQSISRVLESVEVTKYSPLLSGGSETLFVWYDHEDMRRFLDIALDVRKWDSSHHVVRVLECLEHSSREWGHRIPRSFVQYLEDDLIVHLSSYKPNYKIVDNLCKEISCGYFTFKEETQFDLISQSLDHYFLSRSSLRSLESNFEFFLEHGRYPTRDDRMKGLASMGSSF